MNLLDIRSVALIVLFSLIFCSCSSSKPVAAKATPAPVRKEVSAKIAPGIEDQILLLINQHRKKKGLRVLESNYVIATVARNHTMAMAKKQVAFGHSGMGARTKYIRGKIQGVNAVAENVAYGSTSAEEVVAGWLKSPGHKKNIEGPSYRLTGIGVARDVNSRLYYTQIFSD